jgi:hypothetical protein
MTATELLLLVKALVEILADPDDQIVVGPVKNVKLLKATLDFPSCKERADPSFVASQ